MTKPAADGIRLATPADLAQLLSLWAMVFDDDRPDLYPSWMKHAQQWFGRAVEDPGKARFPVIDIAGEVVATAVGTLELGVPNPHCPRGRTVRLANVITLPAHRGNGHATRIVLDVIEWARSIHADRVDLGATPDGLGIYEKAGFTLTRAPRMKLVL